jgi:CSLREA domain-containing protein
MNKKKTSWNKFFRQASSAVLILVFLLSLIPVPAARAATITVNTTSDPAPDANHCGTNPLCPLRGAIVKANNSPTPDIILFDGTEFAIDPTIELDGTYDELPEILYPVQIVGLSNGGNVILDGVNVSDSGSGSVESGLRFGVDADGSSVSDMTITNFDDHGVYVLADSMTLDGLTLTDNGDDGVFASAQDGLTVQDGVIFGNGNDGVSLVNGSTNSAVADSYIGVEADGFTGNGNGAYGVRIIDSSDSMISNNTISANSSGVLVREVSGTADNNSILGNSIGLDSNGNDASIGNTSYGVWVDEASNTHVGGAGGGQGNFISANTNGVRVDGAGSTGTGVSGNHIGMDWEGEVSVPNTNNGVMVVDGDNVTVGPGNLISANGGRGVYINTSGGASTDIFVTNNLIGVDVDGNTNHGNADDGVYIANTDGGTTSGNVISANGSDGVTLNNTMNYTVSNNTIGLDDSKTVTLSNTEFGVLITGGSVDNVIGGASGGQGNTISGNTLDGVRVTGGASTVGNSILGNSIYANGELGIDLAGDGVTNNDLGSPPDTDVGPNNIQNYPVVYSAKIDTATNELTLDVGLSSVPGTDFRLEFFYNTSCDASGNGEGRTMFHAEAIQTDSVTFPGLYRALIVVPGVSFTTGFVTSTATLDLTTGGFTDTSEFSECVSVEDVTGPGATDTFVVNSVADDSDAGLGNGLCLTGAGECTLRAAIEQANADGAATAPYRIIFDIPGPGPYIINPASPFDVITTPVIIDGTTQIGYGGQPIIAVDGGLIPGGPGLQIQADGSEVMALAFYDFSTGEAILIDGADDTVITDNYIGVQMDGTTRDANLVGVVINNGSNNDILDNLISGNNWDGVQVNGASSVGNVISGNYIGTDFTGFADIGNVANGIFIDGAQATVIGSSGNRNLISGNGENGIYITGGGDGTFISFNYIGTAANGTSGIRNDDSGVLIEGSDQTSILNNTIAFNGNGATEDGITVLSTVFGPTTYGVNNYFSQNSMFSNANLGIDLEDDGVTPNDGLGDPDTGANNLQNYPVLTTASTGPTYTYIEGSLTSAASSSFTIDFYEETQGEAYISSVVVNTDGSGFVAFQALLPQTYADGQIITAVARGGNNSSEFSALVVVLGVAPPIPAPSISVVNTNDANNDTVYTGSELALSPGALVSFRNTFTNTGTTDITIDSLSNDTYPAQFLAGCGALVGTNLAPAASVNCTFVAAVTAVPLTFQLNTTTVQASDALAQVVAAQGSSTVTTPDTDPGPPDITIDYTNDANNNGSYTYVETANSSGQTVSFRLVINNNTSENVTITSITDDTWNPTIASGTCDSLIGSTLGGNATVNCNFTATMPNGTIDIDATITVVVEDDETDTDTANDVTTVKFNVPTNTPSGGGGAIFTATRTSTPIFVTATPTGTLPTSTVTGTPPTATGTPPTSTNSLFLSSNTPTLTPTTGEGIGGGALEFDTATPDGSGGGGGLSSEDIRATSNANATATQVSIEAAAQSGGLGDLVRLWWVCLIPAILALLIGGGLELYRWLNSRQA